MMLTLRGYVAHYILGGLCHTKSTFHVDFECGVYISSIRCHGFSFFFSLLILAELIFKGGYCSRVAFIIFGETGGH